MEASVPLAKAPWVAAGVAACGCVAVALADPSRHSLTPPCPFRALTGWWCPFCGGTRAVGRLVRGDLGAAWRLNALVVLAVPVVVALWLTWVRPGRWPALERGRAALRRATGPLLAVLVAFVVVRNLPWGLEHLRVPGA